MSSSYSPPKIRRGRSRQLTTPTRARDSVLPRRTPSRPIAVQNPRDVFAVLGVDASVDDSMDIADVEPLRGESKTSTRKMSKWVPVTKKEKKRRITMQMSPGDFAATYGLVGKGFPDLQPEQAMARVADKVSGNGRYRRKRRRPNYKYARGFTRYRRRGSYSPVPGMYTRGQGGFWGDAWNAVRTPMLDIAQTGLAAIPGYGGALSAGLGAARKAGGWGAYGVANNALVNGGQGSGGVFVPPTFSDPSDTGGMTISHKDIIGNLYAPPDGGFHTQSFDINPGLEATFPWLAQIAANFQEYELVQCIVSFQSQISEFTTTTGNTGQVVTATQYDPHAKEFESFQEMISVFGSGTCKANQNLVSGIECDPAKLAGAPGKYIRSSGLEKDRDIKDFDHGKFVIGLHNFPVDLRNKSIGLLHISYTVRVRRPSITTGRGLAISRDQYIQAVNSSDLPTPTDRYTELQICDVVRTTPSTVGSSPQLHCRIYDPDNTGNLFQNSKNSIECLLTEAPAKLGKCSVTVGGIVMPFQQWNTSSTLAYLGAPLYSASSETPNVNAWGSFKGLTITFPARFSGSMSVTLRLTATNNLATCGVAVDHTGNVKPINDLMTGYHACPTPEEGVAAWDLSPCLLAAQGRNTASCVAVSNSIVSAAPASSSGTAVQFGTVDIELHVELDQATGGVNNTVSLYLLTNNTGTTAKTYLINSSLIVEEYNAGYVDRKDVPTIENIQTGAALLQARNFTYDI